MSYLALYRKYRPVSLNDLVGQNDVSEIIKNEIIKGKISHAYLFSGPRGTGKTSTAKIIARMLNCSNLSDDGVPCGVCENCLNFVSSTDVVEIDAASNNGVDEIRELRDKVNLVPTVGKYKIYIIDEVHMLTTQAFNALLKTLEEPPSHVIFILATTEFYKIPATVVSRCQKFQFLRFTNEEIVTRLVKISNLENIDVDNSVLNEIARLSDGGLRDAINMLDQLSSFKNGKINIDDVYQLNGAISYDEISDLFVCLSTFDVQGIVNFIDDINKYGKNIDRFLVDVINFLKDVLIYKNISDIGNVLESKMTAIQNVSDIFSVEQVYDIIISLNDLCYKIKNSDFSAILLVTYFIKKANDLKKIDNKLIEDSNNSNSNILIGNNKDNLKLRLDMDDKCIKSKVINNGLKKIIINNAFATASKQKKDDIISNWNKVKDVAINFKYNSVIGILDDVEILVVGDSDIIFLVKYDSLLERIYDYVKDIENILFKVFNIEYKIVFIVAKEWLNEKKKYIDNMKSGKKYKYIDESLYEEKEGCNTNELSDIDKIVDILGEDVISYN